MDPRQKPVGNDAGNGDVSPVAITVFHGDGRVEVVHAKAIQSDRHLL